AKSVETRAVSFELSTEGCRLALAKTIPIDQRDQIVQMVNARDRGGLPNGPFRALAVAEQDVSSKIQVIEFRAERHAGAGAQALAQRACRHVNERQPRGGMPFQIGAEQAQLE